MLAPALGIGLAASVARIPSGRNGNGQANRHGSSACRLCPLRRPCAVAVRSIPYRSSGWIDAVTASRRWLASTCASSGPRRCPSSIGTPRVSGSIRTYFFAEKACTRCCASGSVSTCAAASDCSSFSTRRCTSSSQYTRRSTQLPRDHSTPNTERMALFSAPRFVSDGRILCRLSSPVNRRPIGSSGASLAFLTGDLDFAAGLGAASAADFSGAGTSASNMSAVKMFLWISSCSGVSLYS